MAGIGGECDLFGNPVAPLAPRQAPRPVTNDMELIEQVLRIARDTKLFLIGAREDVYQHVVRDEVEKVPPRVDAAVHQLLEAKWLETGGTHRVRYGRLTGPARSVLVPRKSKHAAYRWAALKNPWSQNCTQSTQAS